jgi:hypothetical protein
MASGGLASELKQQGALEAANDPNSSVTAEQAELKVVQETRKGGGAAFQFDPNASAEDKAKQLDSVSTSLPRPCKSDFFWEGKG